MKLIYIVQVHFIYIKIPNTQGQGAVDELLVQHSVGSSSAAAPWRPLGM